MQQFIMRTFPPAREIDDLLGRSPTARAHRCRNLPRYWKPSVVRLLLDRAFELRFSRPAEMIELSRLAIECAARCELPLTEAADLQAEAWTCLGNAYKIRGQFRAANRALRTAARYVAAGSGEASLVARLSGTLGSLRIRQARFPEAIAALKLALEERERLGEPTAIAVDLIALAIATNEAGQPVEALTLVTRACELTILAKNPRLALIVRHYGAFCLLEMGSIDRALEVVQLLAPLYEKAADPMILIRQHWLEAQILAGYGSASRDRAAEEGFRATADEALGLGLPYEAAQILLDLGVFYAQRGRFTILPDLLEEILPVFDELGIGRESLTVRLLQRAVKKHSRTVELLRKTRQRIERLNVE
jgi:tetratricopeptide (TPR) repeat protein